jgi:polysaccharide deacetylase family protein (PEP-CTERM system associated)
MNILTFDIEEWYIEKEFRGNRNEKYALFNGVLDQILDLLDEVNTKATFFCLGEIANSFPYVIKRIDRRGHEIGCHSNKHLWLTDLSKDAVFLDTRKAVDSLEQSIGKKVLSYRAPAFSIGKNNLWAFEALVKSGIERDASVFPAVRDFGGFPSFEHKTPSTISYGDFRIKEFPVSTSRLFGSEVAYSGGGYFRFFPLSYVLKQMSNQTYTMVYFHIGDIFPEMPRIMTKKEHVEYFKEKGHLVNRYKRYLKSNLGAKSAYNKLAKLIRSESFINLHQADSIIDWNQVPIIKL